MHNPPSPPLPNESLVPRTLPFGPSFFGTELFGTERRVQRTVLFEPCFLRIVLFAGHGVPPWEPLPTTLHVLHVPLVRPPPPPPPAREQADRRMEHLRELEKRRKKGSEHRGEMDSWDAVRDTIIMDHIGVQWTDIVGLDEAKEVVRQVVALPCPPQTPPIALGQLGGQTGSLRAMNMRSYGHKTATVDRHFDVDGAKGGKYDIKGQGPPTTRRSPRSR